MPERRHSAELEDSLAFRPWTWEDANALYRTIPDAGRRALADVAVGHLQRLEVVDSAARDVEQPARQFSSDEVSCEILHHIVPSGEFLVVLNQLGIDCSDLAERWRAKHHQYGGCTYGQ